MIYTDTQKKIINGIAKREYTNIWEYLLSITPETDQRTLKDRKTENDFNWHICFWNDQGGEKKYRYIRVDSGTEKRVLDFFTICQDLSLKNLLLSMFPYGYFLVTYSHRAINQDKAIQRISQLLTERLPSEPIGQLGGEIIRENFIPLPALNEFINNDYRTIEVLNQQVQFDLQKSALKLTQKIAYVTLTITTLLSIIPFIYNLWNPHSSDRNVTLKNPTDTIRVINITPSPVIPKDSVRLDSTNNK